MTIEEIKKLVLCGTCKNKACRDDKQKDHCDTWAERGNLVANAYIMGMRKAFEECVRESYRTDDILDWASIKVADCASLAKECAK